MSKTLIVFAGKYDQGTAGAKRVRQFARGLRLAGDDAFVIGYYRGNYLSSTQIQWKIDLWGVPFSEVHIKKGALTNIKVFWDALTLSSRLGELAVRSCREQGCDRVILYGTNWFMMRSVVKRLSKLRILVIADFTEWWVINGGQFYQWLSEALFKCLCVSKLSGLIGISSFWKTYASKVAKPIILIPAMVDEVYNETIHVRSSEFIIVYVGPLFRRDLPEAMLDGILLAIDRGIQLQFHIIGSSGFFPESVRFVQRINKDPVLNKRVHLHGWISREKINHIYAEADSFLLLRGNDLQSVACFPTRLSEFLSTGVPVITSNTDNVSSYLKHLDNCYLLSPGNAPEELADAICYLVTHEKDRIKIGKAGQDLANQKMNFQHHGCRLKSFLDELQVEFK